MLCDGLLSYFLLMYMLDRKLSLLLIISIL